MTPDEFRHILTTFGEKMEPAEVDEYIAEADTKCPDLKPNGDKSGLINYIAFVRIILDLPEEIVPPATVRVLPTLPVEVRGERAQTS